MKPCNFPGRKAIRRDRATARAAGMESWDQPVASVEVANITHRYGASQRGADGRALPGASMAKVGKKAAQP